MARARYTPAQREQIIDAVIDANFSAAAAIFQASGRVHDQLIAAIDDRRGAFRGEHKLSVVGVPVVANDAMPDDLLIATGAEGRVVAVVRIPIADTSEPSDGERYHG